MTNRKRTNTPVIPFIQLHDTGLQVFTTVGEFHTWDNISFKTSDFHYTEDDDRVLINIPSAGYYEVTFECSFTKSGAGLGAAVCTLYKNGEVVTGATAVGCAYDTGQGAAACACITLHFIIYLKGRDYIQVKTTASADSLISGSQTSRLLVKFIPTQGWNNDNGGNTNYRGRVSR